MFVIRDVASGLEFSRVLIEMGKDNSDFRPNSQLLQYDCCASRPVSRSAYKLRCRPRVPLGETLLRNGKRSPGELRGTHRGTSQRSCQRVLQAAGQPRQHPRALTHRQQCTPRMQPLFQPNNPMLPESPPRLQLPALRRLPTWVQLRCHHRM